jgi:lipopolysaccharide/colanic/teichoic acid biosynthesis glycosyltransferase
VTIPAVRQSALPLGRSRGVKGVFDVVFAAALALATLPLGLLIALAIVLDSRGPVFFCHTRLGRGRRPFRLWKFRTMIVASDGLFQEYLHRNPELAREWRLTHKLRGDPRVTRVGRFLRKTSLDELPQLWNVLRGDMSMVGPRPIVPEEIAMYGPAFALYSQVSPGLTGLWQVSGRNDTHYHRRVELDGHYIRHWTLWLDGRILLRTVRVVSAATLTTHIWSVTCHNQTSPPL